MISAIRTRMQEREEGFTLIELLVVVIIIGILAAIAIPTFLSQRERGWEAELTSAVRNAALEVEAAATQSGGVYPAQADGQDLVDDFVADQLGNAPVTLTYGVVASPAGFTIEGSHDQLSTTVTYDSTQGGLQ